MISLRLPVKHIDVNQPFGVNFVDFYKKLGLNGHNGVDFKALNGNSCYASHSGKVYFAGEDDLGGLCVILVDEINHFKTVYGHLKEFLVTKGDSVQAGQKIALCDNTGKMTTGSHLHFTLKLVDDKNFNTINYDNGFKGAIDPAPYFNFAYDGTEIGNKDWDKSNAYHRYYRGRPKGGLVNEIKVVKSLIPYLKRLPRNEEINACTYGGWNREVLKNPAMYQIWAFIKRSEYEEGIIPFKH